MIKLNISISAENEGDPRGGGWLGNPNISVHRKNVEKEARLGKYRKTRVVKDEGVQGLAKQLRHKRGH